jgi:UDP-glucose 4-epimerase
MFGDDYQTPDGTCVRDYIHISDLAQAHVRAIEGRFEGAFNLGNGEGYSVRQVVDAARRVTGHAIPAAVSPRRPGDPDRLVADARKAREVLGWRPDHTDLDEIVRSAWEWSRRHPRGYRT